MIDLYSVKPLDADTLIRQAQKANKRVITVEDHFIQGGLGEAVCYALRNEDVKIDVLAVKELSRSGKPQELLAYHRIDHTAIIETREFIASLRHTVLRVRYFYFKPQKMINFSGF